MTYVYGDQPEFSPEEKTEIRRVLGDAWNQAHAEKNAVADRPTRKALSDRMRRYEGLMEKVGQL